MIRTLKWVLLLSLPITAIMVGGMVLVQLTLDILKEADDDAKEIS